ncbi:SDR family NAD(P)-dependent oxidoreductase [Rhizobium bangladeshense]|uniref:SDR family NAD(P)-dependent oxidoreductase n=1 Tax=Rhizobium bangladeshense TaxID=1138189 RepID=UPI001C832982|nr:SDR family oxidoreductase [Rhizobium bangladeshense]
MERRKLLMGMGAGIAAAAALANSSQAQEADRPAPSVNAGKENGLAVITGVSSGIGQATALALAERGVHTIGTYRNNEQGARQTAEDAQRLGVKVVLYHLDLNHMDSIKAFQENVRATLRREWNTDKFDYLVNNAGMSIAAPFNETTEEAFDEMSRVLFKGHFFMTQGLLSALRDGGAIVNVASSATRPTSVSPGYSAYAAMKGGLTTLTRYMAKELAPRGIRVNSVAPGPTRTRLGNDGFARHPEVIPAIAAQTALSRLGEPSDLGRSISGLLSDDLAWITGENIEISGGFRM